MAERQWCTRLEIDFVTELREPAVAVSLVDAFPTFSAGQRIVEVSLQCGQLAYLSLLDDAA